MVDERNPERCAIARQVVRVGRWEDKIDRVVILPIASRAYVLATFEHVVGVILRIEPDDGNPDLLRRRVSGEISFESDGDVASDLYCLSG